MQKRAPSKAKPPGSSADAGGAPDVSFEEALASLERIIDRIESGKVGLEDSIAEYERGVDLLRRCRAILDRAEQRVAELSAPPADERAR